MSTFQCVTKPKIWTKPNPKLFSDTKFFRYRIRYFFRYQFFSIPIPILFSIPKFFETNTDTFFDTQIFRNRYRYFFRYQFFSKPIPILFLKPKIFETDTNTIQTIGIVSKPRSLETETSHSDTKSLWFHDLALYVRRFCAVLQSSSPQPHWGEAVLAPVRGIICRYLTYGLYVRPLYA